ncbi:MAG: hypothetical protein EA373_10655 [Oceanospirillales bacterium]|nr:MAG: hypothetical protein EA373_10655 [Oceanospirillales bacterium]
MQGMPLVLACLLLLSGCAEAPVKAISTPVILISDQSDSDIWLPETEKEAGFDKELDEETIVETDPFIAIERQVYPDLPDRLRVERIANLPDEVNESSGLAMRKGRLWTHNDSGHDAILYELSESGDKVLRRVHPLNSVNEDWEALAQDDQTLYIADCGNNLGDRIWMQIYKVAWQDLDQSRDQGVVPSERLSVRLADTRPERNRHAHNNDCEALTVVGDELWLFTKNWQDHNTRLYRINKEAPVQQLVTSGEFPARGLITGADFDPASQRLALIGYRLGFMNVSAFIWIVPVVDNAPDWDQASYHSINPVGQWEAILWHEGNLLVSRESSVLGRAQLGRIVLP